MNQVNKELITKLVRLIECLCCIPITIYGFYYEPMDQPIALETVEHYI
jgi:hypothetical protein